MRFGVLPNGMRYAIMKNATPEKQVSLRLRIGSGSLQEQTSQQGLAHFLEHMAFRGSKSVPDGEVKKQLERLGLQMGADTNAFTGQTQTVYKFDLARNDEESIDHGLLFMRETCDALTLDPQVFDIERGVVLSELRLSDTPARHSQDALAAFSMPRQLASERMPIGKKPVLEAATVALLRDYYRKWYRPERATFIVTGDIDIDAIETKIRSRFGDWKSSTPLSRDPDLGKPAARSAEAKVYTEPGVAPVAEIEWVTPYDDSIDSFARERRELIQQIGFRVINRRLQAAAAAADRRFTQAAVGHNPISHSAEITTLYVSYDADAWRPALMAAETLRRQAVEGGVQQEEVDREIAIMRTSFKDAAAGAATRRTPQLAEALVGSVDRDEVFTSPAQDLEESEAIFKDLTADTVNEALRATFSAGGPLAFIANPNSIADGDERAIAALNEVERATVVAAAAIQKEEWPYTGFGTPGTVADRKHVDDLDFTQVRFANGVRLNIKSTQFTADQVLVQVSVDGGRARMPTDRPSLMWANASMVTGGTGKLDYQSIQRVLAGKSYTVMFSMADDAFVLSGATTPASLLTQLQVLSAYATDPGFRQEAFDQTRSNTQRQLTEMASTPNGVFGLNVGSLFHSGDMRWAPPTSSGIAAAKVDELKALIAPGLTHNGIEICVVGDVQPDPVINAVAATFGALPARESDTSSAFEGVHFPQGVEAPVRLTHQGAADQGITAIAWPTTDAFSDTRQIAVRQLLADIMSARLYDTVRAAAGAAYSPQASGSSSTVFKNYGYLYALADVPPSKSQPFYDAVAKIVQDLRSNPVSSDELDRARNPALSKLAQAQQTNGYWANALAHAQSDPRYLDLERHRYENLKAVTAADVQQAATLYLVDDKAFRLIVQPAGTP